MRTKTLLLSAALVAAGVASSMAQSNVYSLNIVGYVNIPVQAGKAYILNNPFDTGTGNNITNVLIQPYMGGTNDVPDPALDAGWDGTIAYTFSQASGYTLEGYNTGFGWFPGTTTLAPGTGFWLFPTTNSTVTFTGSVILSSTTTLAPGIQLVGSQYPGNSTLAALGLGVASATSGSATEHANDGDIVYRWYGSAVPAGYSGTVQSYSQAIGFNTGYGWFDNDAPGGTGGSTNGPVIGVGEGFWYLNTGAAVSWPQSFTVN